MCCVPSVARDASVLSLCHGCSLVWSLRVFLCCVWRGQTESRLPVSVCAQGFYSSPEQVDLAAASDSSSFCGQHFVKCSSNKLSLRHLKRLAFLVLL